MIYMDFVYQPEIAAMLAEYINYITPVPAAQDADREGRGEGRPGDDKDVTGAVADQPADLPGARPTSPSCTATSTLERRPTQQHVPERIFEPIVAGLGR